MDVLNRNSFVCSAAPQLELHPKIGIPIVHFGAVERRCFVHCRPFGLLPVNWRPHSITEADYTNFFYTRVSNLQPVPSVTFCIAGSLPSSATLLNLPCFYSRSLVPAFSVSEHGPFSFFFSGFGVALSTAWESTPAWESTQFSGHRFWIWSRTFSERSSERNVV